MKIVSAPVIVTLLAIGSIALAVIYNGHKIEEKANAPRPMVNEVDAPEVSVISVKPGEYQTYISSHGEAKAHWELSLNAQVEGEVITVTDEFETGRNIKKGQVIANIDNTDYLQAIASAKADIADAQLTYQEESDLAEQAKREWARSGVKQEPSSPLVFRTLQLEAAKTTVESAKQSLKAAIRNEGNTHIRAPFDAVILTRSIDLGSYVNVGDTVATLNSTDKIEVSVPLSLNQWQYLTDDNSGCVLLKDLNTGHTWSGYIDRKEQHLDDASRQRNIIVALDNPFEAEKPLIPGTFLSVEIGGKQLQNVLELPSSAISQDGDVWYANEQNKLVNVTANKLFERDELVYISPIYGVDEALIVVRPLVSYLSGMSVTPVIDGDVQ